MKLVTVIIPYCGRIQWVAEALSSVLNQTYPEVELILVNDGSPSHFDTVEVEHPALRHLRQENAGPGAARNHGIRHASGSYIAFLDSDDLFLPHKLEKQVSVMEEHPDALLSFSSYSEMTSSGKSRGERIVPEQRGSFYPDILADCRIHTSTVMLRAEILSRATVTFPEDTRVVEDVIFWVRMARLGPFVAIPDVLSKVRIHDNAAVRSNDQQIAGQKRLIEFIRDPESHLDTPIRRRLLAQRYVRLAALTGQRDGLVRCVGWLIRSIVVRPASVRHVPRVLMNSAVWSAKRRLSPGAYELARRKFDRQ